MGIRTPGLVIANDALYQLSYTPDFAGVMLTAPQRFSRPRKAGVTLRGSASPAVLAGTSNHRRRKLPAER